jgi:hypothetical protein
MSCGVVFEVQPTFLNSALHELNGFAECFGVRFFYPGANCAAKRLNGGMPTFYRIREPGL